MQCIVNVLTNAIKYTDPGGEIGVKTYTDASSAIIEISDTGTGISSDLLPRVFDLFVQGDRALDRNQGGLGIGLSVVKRLVEMQGGRVEARSAGLGQGSCFKICLPLIERPTETVTDPEVHQSKPVRVLIVDDNQDAADSLALLLRLKGHEVETIYAAEGVVERARVFEPAIVLLDLGLPGIDGYEVARILRETPELSGLRIIAITGYGRTEDRERTQAAGFNDHLIKPVDLSRLDRLLAGIPNRRDRLVLRRASAR
jgi:CheY-like chemotaxis protein